MKRFIIVSVISVCLGALLLHAAKPEEFTVKPKKKNVSVNTLREECCQVCGDLVSILPDALHTIADVQTVSAQMIAGYFESDKQSFCMKADRDKLAQCLERLENIRAAYERLAEELATECQELKKVITTQ